FHVTGVQTCALPISDVLGDDVERREEVRVGEGRLALEELVDNGAGALADALEAPAVGGGLEARVLERWNDARPALHGFRRGALRSEERRVGKAGRSW